MGGGRSVSWAAGVIGAQGGEGKGREVSHGGEARTSQARWFLPTLRFEIIRHDVSQIGSLEVFKQQDPGWDIVSETKGKRKGQLQP